MLYTNREVKNFRKKPINAFRLYHININYYCNSEI